MVRSIKYSDEKHEITFINTYIIVEYTILHSGSAHILLGKYLTVLS